MPPPRVTSPPITTPNVASSSSAGNSSVVQGNSSGSGARSVRQSLLDLGRRNRTPADVQQASSSSSAVLHRLLPNALLKKTSPHLPLLMSAASSAAQEWNCNSLAEPNYPKEEALQHCERFIEEIVPVKFIDTVLKKNGALIPEAESFLRSFAGLRMVKDALNPMHLQLLTAEAGKALADIQRYNDPELTSLCVYFATSVACSDSLNDFLTQTKQALLAHRAKECKSIDEVFALLRPSFNQGIVQAKTHEITFREYERNNPWHSNHPDSDSYRSARAHEFARSGEFQESVEYYVQIAAQVSKQAPLVESLKSSTYGDHWSFELDQGRLSSYTEEVLREIHNKSHHDDPHFLDFFATHSAFQNALKRRYPHEYRREVQRPKEAFNKAFNGLSATEQGSPQWLEKGREVQQLDEKWFLNTAQKELRRLVHEVSEAPGNS